MGKIKEKRFNRKNNRGTFVLFLILLVIYSIPSCITSSEETSVARAVQRIRGDINGDGVPETIVLYKRGGIGHFTIFEKTKKDAPSRQVWLSKKKNFLYLELNQTRDKRLKEIFAFVLPEQDPRCLVEIYGYHKGNFQLLLSEFISSSTDKPQLKKVSEDKPPLIQFSYPDKDRDKLRTKVYQWDGEGFTEIMTESPFSWAKQIKSSELGEIKDIAWSNNEENIALISQNENGEKSLILLSLKENKLYKLLEGINFSDKETDFSWSAEGKYLAFVWKNTEGDRTNLCLLDVYQGKKIIIANKGINSHPNFSLKTNDMVFTQKDRATYSRSILLTSPPYIKSEFLGYGEKPVFNNGEKIAFIEEEKIWILDLPTKKRDVIFPSFPPDSLLFSPDNNAIIYKSENKIMFIDLKTLEERLLYVYLSNFKSNSPLIKEINISRDNKYLYFSQKVLNNHYNLFKLNLRDFKLTDLNLKIHNFNIGFRTGRILCADKNNLRIISVEENKISNLLNPAEDLSWFYQQEKRQVKKIYRIQIGAKSDFHQALSLADRFFHTEKDSNFYCEVRPVWLNNKLLYRVRVGSFNSLDEAQKYSLWLQKEGFETWLVKDK